MISKNLSIDESLNQRLTKFEKEKPHLKLKLASLFQKALDEALKEQGF